VGPSFCAVFLFGKSDEQRFNWRFWVVVFCDMLGMLLITISISYAGSSIFFVTFSWITIFAAVLKRIFLGKGQTCYQWVALIVLTIGLCSSAADAEVDDGPKVFYGVMAGMGSAVVYSIYYVICDVLGHLEDAPSPESLCAFDGLVGTWCIGLYIALHDGPHWQELVDDPMRKVGNTARIILLEYARIRQVLEYCSSSNLRTSM
jgi:drug/metabolite transporter (DMT)-like permease